MARKVLLEFRRDTAANWTATNPTLSAGEPGFETDTGKLKIGDGSTAWNSLSYIAAPSGVSPLTTKGDLYGFTSTNARIPVGSDTQVLTADSSQSAGVKWAGVPSDAGHNPTVWPLNCNMTTDPLSFTPSVNAYFGARCIVQRTGTLNDLACWTGVAAHNVDIGVYDTSATTRNRLYHSGLVASVAGGWVSVTGVGLSVNVGDHIDIAVLSDTNAASFLARFAGFNAAQYKLPSGLLVAPGGAGPWLGWEAAAGSAALPATVAESTFVNFGPVVALGWVT